GSSTGGSTAVQNVLWETNGYDWDPNSGAITPNKFKGYSMGPGYYGKTFYIWPPDPRASVNLPGVGGVPGDWRKRFFTYYGSATRTDENTKLSNTGNGRPQTTPTNTFSTASAAILAWIKPGPKVMPDNLRSGRGVYYPGIPNDVNYTAGSTAPADLDKRFW